MKISYPYQTIDSISTDSSGCFKISSVFLRGNIFIILSQIRLILRQPVKCLDILIECRHFMLKKKKTAYQKQYQEAKLKNLNKLQSDMVMFHRCSQDFKVMESAQPTEGMGVWNGYHG